MIKKHIKSLNLFSIISIISAILIMMALINMFSNILSPPSDTWYHIKNYLLAEYLKNTFILIFFTGLLSGFLGFMSAYIVTFYEFKGRKLFSWILILPLALPSYIAAFIYSDMFSYTGIFSRTLRSIGINKYIDIMSISGAIVIFSFTLYPYVYMLVKSSLSKNSSLFIENAKLLKAKPLRIFTKIVLPLTRPALFGGVLLVLLETLNDYGVVRYFGVRVFSYAIFDSWFRLGDLTSAVRLSAIVLIIVFILVNLEKILRGRKKYTANVKTKPIIKKQVNRYFEILIIAFLSIIILVGFGIPVTQMIFNFVRTYQVIFELEMIYIIINTVTISLFATVLTVFISVMIINYSRLSNSKLTRAVLRITSIGYAIPGAVIAVSVLIFFVDVDNLLYPIYKLIDGDSKKLILTTSLAMLTFAYVIRFLTISFNSVESIYDKVGIKYTEAAYTLKSSKLRTLFKIDIPLIKEGLIAAFIIVFIDVIKELPLTLILRPTNYDTIATRVYTYANDEMIQEASGPALIIILICTLMIYYVTHRKRGGKNVR